MVLWINLHQNNSLVNLVQFPLLWEKTGALAIVELDLMAGKQAGQQAVRQMKLL